jgi:S-adenosylmethionine:diacylglycerol 3-amino-3-carboxypropyl transferase
MSHLYNFGVSQEDERTEAAALRVAEGRESRVLSVCSAGEMPLCLLSLGATRVDAVDIDERQLHLAWLKRAAALTLDRRRAIRFLGYLPATADQRRAWLARVSAELPAAARAFFDDRSDVLERGPIWVGRYERYVSRLVRLLRVPLGRRLDGLFSDVSLDEQRAYFRRMFDRPWLRAVFEAAFHPRVFARRGMDPRSLRHRGRAQPSLGRQYFEQFRALCTHTPARENHLLQLHLLGRVLSSDAVPHYLSAGGFEVVRRRIDRLTLRRLDLHAALRAAPRGTYNRFHLSNLPDWISAGGFATTMQLLAERSERDGRAVWRYIHVDRPVPDGLRGSIRVDHEEGERLGRLDRFPFYTVVPADIGAGAEAGADGEA